MILLLQCLVICFHVTTENGTETESRPKMSVICASIFHIKRAKRKNFITMSEFMQNQAGDWKIHERS